jgi:YbbR domain-containing protein
VLTVSGEASVVTQMQNAMTTPIDINGRTTDLEAMVQFALPDGVSVSGTNSVRVVVTIAEMTGTRTFQVGVEMVGQDTGNSYVSSPPSVQVVLGGPISALDAVDASQLVATADVSPLAAGSGATPVPVSFTPPPGMDLVSITPDSLIITADTLPSPSISATVEPQ